MLVTLGRGKDTCAELHERPVGDERADDRNERRQQHLALRWLARRLEVDVKDLKERLDNLRKVVSTQLHFAIPQYIERQ